MVGKNMNAFRFIYDLRDSVTSFWSSFFIILSQQGPVFRRWSIFAYSFDFSEIFACAKKLCSVIDTAVTDSAVSVTLLSFLWNRGVLQVFFFTWLHCQCLSKPHSIITSVLLSHPTIVAKAPVVFLFNPSYIILPLQHLYYLSKTTTISYIYPLPPPPLPRCVTTSFLL